ncbi:hypothetical protein BZL29_0819 [Mycobacterium kansasii]|uniref:Uncharacterized protein n=1 Tax=Mycobacterium kansasii TaxID=1768 RepID=A0A1V3XWD2_MYCKA|nr:hypothetical protein BZL29_0819 [Mycobacterium kansasii]
MALMPEPVPASEETAALGGETAALPDSAPTNAVHTAWSHSDQPDQPDESDQPDASQDVRDDDRTSAIEAAVQTWGTTWAAPRRCYCSVSASRCSSWSAVGR